LGATTLAIALAASNFSLQAFVSGSLKRGQATQNDE